MFERMTPEAAGIPSSAIAEYIRHLNHIEAATHGILIMKGTSILEEAYWSPFAEDVPHRMYSQTKSFVGIAIGLLEAEGKLSLDDKILPYFTDRVDGEVHPWLREQTIREMLTMTTVGGGKYWFTAGDPDRVHLYLNRQKLDRPSGTVWEYDSSGSQVLAALAERLSGKPLLDYLKEKLFDQMGTFRTAEILKTPNGESWGDSAMVCTLRDIASFGRLLMQGGRWNGEQLIPEDYVKTATSAVVDNGVNEFRHVFSKGYGYQIWRTEQNGFAFLGMGDQITICLPDRDLLFTIISDNQGAGWIREEIVNGFFSGIVNRMADTPLAENPEEYAKLQALNDSLTLRIYEGEGDSPLRPEIDGAVYECPENALGMKRFSLSFEKDGGVFRYVNAQGEKEIPFGIGHNVFGRFPQDGYSDGAGCVPTANGFRYRDAVSACWKQKNRFCIFVQIIDRYLGNLLITFSFRENLVFCTFAKTAEAFLEEYNGSFTAKKV